MTKGKRSTPQGAADVPNPSRHGTPTWARALWWATLLLGAAVLLASLPAYARFIQGHNPFYPEAPADPFSTIGGLTSLFTSLTCFALAIVLFRRKRNEPMALFVSFYLISYGAILAGPLEFLGPLLPWLGDFTVGVVQPIFFALPTIAMMVLFPNGRPIPRWTRWLIFVAALEIVLLPLPWISGVLFPTSLALASQLLYGSWIILATVFVLAVYGQVYRYRRVSTPAQRHQTKWVLVGFVFWWLLMLVQSVPYVYVTSLPPGAPQPAWATALAALWFLSLSIVPICLTIAILRYRLYEIDLIINRALVYGGLTAVLAGLYSASISLFQKAFIAVTGEQSDAAIVLTTLILASVFTPLRTRLQTAVDRRFKDVHDPPRRLRALAYEIVQGIWVLHPQQAAHRLLAESVAAFGATGGAVYWGRGRLERQTDRIGEWKDHEAVTAALTAENQVLGRIVLGPRRDQSSYSPEDRRALAESAEAVAVAFFNSPLAPRPRRRQTPAAKTPADRRRRREGR